MKLLSSLHAFVLWMMLCYGSAAHADVVLRGFDPTVPNAAQVPSLVLDVLRGSGITTCEGSRADVPAKVSVQGSVILIKLYMSRVGTGNPFCQTFPSSFGLRWPLESGFPAGTFTARVFGSPQSFEPNSTAPDFLLGELPITVLASPVAQVPLFGLPQLTALSLFLVFFGVWHLRKGAIRPSHFLGSFILALISCSAFSQNHAKPLPQLQVELRSGLDIAALVQSAEANVATARPFALGRPKYSGLPGPILNGFQEREVAQLVNHPVLQRRRILVLTYAPGTDLIEIKLALRADARVVKIVDSEADESGFSAATTSTAFFSLPSLATTAFGTQYGLDALNLSSALRYQDGWAVGAIIDSGIDPTHPEFQAFSGFNSTTQRDNGTFLGAAAGNLLRGLSGDNSVYQTASSVTPSQFGRNIDERRCVMPEHSQGCFDFCRTTNALDPTKCVDVDFSCRSSFSATGIQATVYGHGTHTSGLFGAAWSARTTTNDKVLGTCPGCGLSMRKITQPYCQREGALDSITLAFSDTSISAALWSTTSTGASVASMSLQSSGIGDALTEATARGILLVAAAGNDKDRLQYPASLDSVVPAGGFMPPWPNGYQQSSCVPPSPPAIADQCQNNCSGPECFWINASNYYFSAGQCTADIICGSAASSLTPKGVAQRNAELTVAAKQVMSTFYRTTNSTYPASWTRFSPSNIGLEPCSSAAECQAVCGATTCPSSCAENNDGISDGYGKCTGTSMAAPQLAGLYALLLSSNPLLTVESTVPNYADSSIDGIRDLVATTARAVDSNNVPLVRPKNSWFNFTASLAGTRDLNKTWGAGIPRAKVAMEKIMGTVGGTIAKHRLTPLFVVRQLNDSVPVNYTVSNEFAYATAPSVISSFLNPTNGMAYYSSVGPAVRGFSGFLLGGNLGNPPPQRVVTPAAEVFVLANNYREGANPIDAQGNAPALPPMPAGTNTSQWQIEPLYSMVKCRTQRVANDDYSKAAAEQCVTPPNYGTRINIGGNSLQPYRSPGFESLLALEREVTALNNQGYELRGKVGFVVACKPSETGGCTPLSAPMRGYVQVTRACVGTYPNLATFDCAFTPLANIGTGNYASYSVSNQPTNVGQMPMTYAWENTHSDADDLIDGQEFILGTNPTASNTDGDGYTDSEEWPIAAVSGEEICFRPIPCDPTLGECLPAFAYLPGQKDPLLPCGEPY